MMEKQIKEAFENLKMSNECAEMITAKLNNTDIHPRSGRFAPIAIAACLLLVIFVFTNSTAVAALETVAESVKTAITSLIYPEATAEEQYVFEGGNLVIENNVSTDNKTMDYAVSYNTGSIPDWLMAEGDDLYVLCDGEKVEISSLISNDVPFTHITTDANGIRHYLAVGGVYGTGENALGTVGWVEWMQKEPYDARSWLGGYSTNKSDNRTGENFPWYEAAKDILDIPFP